jgi:deoxyribodipyrimidine photo-lyase
MNEKRVRVIKKAPDKKGPVVYWMSRDQRADDNWALIFAQEKAKLKNESLIIVFCLVPNFLEAAVRQYGFLLKGLQKLEKKLKTYNIPFFLLLGDPGKEIPSFIRKQNASILVNDFDPLKIKKEWKGKISGSIDIPFYEVDAHNIIPSFIASNKEEFSAYTFRSKVNKLLPEYFEEFPSIKIVKRNSSIDIKKINWEQIAKKLKIDFSVKQVDWIQPGESAAAEMLNNFILERINKYDSERNNPVLSGQSNLSPYLHFGQISAQRIALNVEKKEIPIKSKEAFLEELIVRRELADNFCNYNSNYDSFEGFKPWAQQTLNEHRNDKRDFIYSLEEFEKAGTHEDLWNAAQVELLNTGKIHGYMRMYWAKKILEWSSSPEEALRTAVYLNDKYELDGRDPNGYTGCAWSIGGIHDRAWAERKVFGKIRYMNRSGCKRKFNIDLYISKNKIRL